MVGSSILPACVHKGKLYFLFGKENSLADTPGWSDFGGGVDPGESIYDTALREGGEELTGFLGGKDELRSLIKKSGGTYKIVPQSKRENSSYNIHIFNLPYSPDLPKLYNANHNFLWKRMDKKFLNDTKLFEKIEIQWFSLSDMKKKRNQFRNFYREFVDLLIKDQAQIKKFLVKGMTKTRKLYSGSRIGGRNRKTRTRFR
jgi:8-oxo-dGTP pyrophosphatase MutT (NUDIX family)